MTYLDFPLEDGSSLRVEVDDRDAGGPVMRGRAAASVEQAGETFEQALSRVLPAFGVVVTKLRESASRPDHIELEFGLKLSAEMGAIIARTSGEANFRVVVRWDRE